MNDSEQLAVQLWAIGDAVRLRILDVLPYDEDCASRSNVKTLSERLQIPQPTISHHLRVLRQAGIVRKSKHCRDCYYSIDAAAGKRIVNQLRVVIAPTDESRSAR